MSSPTLDRARLLQALDNQTRLRATAMMLVQQAVADQMKINSTDLHCANLLMLMGSMAAGQLAELTGLTTGAITGVIDRLERAGYVWREQDPNDRRRVVVHADSEAIQRDAGPFYESITQAWAALNARYSEQELALLVDYLTRGNALALEEAVKLRQTATQAGESPAGYELTGEHVVVPLESAQSGHLVFTTGATLLNISGDPTQADLLRADFGTRIPSVFVRNGLVKIFYRRSLLSWSKSTADVTLNGNISWRLDVLTSGASCTADLRAVPLKALDVDGTASEVKVTLPQPTANVPFHIAGNASEVVVRRAAGTAMQVRLRRGASSLMASSLMIDGQDLSALGNKPWQTPGYADATQRYEIDVTARMSSVTIETYE